MTQTKSDLPQGSLYPALLRLVNRGGLAAADRHHWPDPELV